MYIYDYMDVSELSPDDYRRGLDGLSPARRERILSYRAHSARRLSAAGDLIARRLAARLLGVSENEICIAQTDAGAPVIPGRPVYVSISHSGGFAAAVAASAPVGMDLQLPREISPALARRICAGSELDYAGGDQARLMRLWTMKEAYGKMTGRGVFTDGLERCFVSDGKLKTDFGSFVFYFPPAPGGGLCSVCLSAN